MQTEFSEWLNQCLLFFPSSYSFRFNFLDWIVVGWSSAFSKKKEKRIPVNYLYRRNAMRINGLWILWVVPLFSFFSFFYHSLSHFLAIYFLIKTVLKKERKKRCISFWKLQFFYRSFVSCVFKATNRRFNAPNWIINKIVNVIVSIV